MVAFHPGAASGSAAVQEVRRFVAGVRETAPSVGVAVAYDRPVNLDRRLLGPRVWVITPYIAAAELDSMLAEVRDARTDRVPAGPTLARAAPASPRAYAAGPFTTASSPASTARRPRSSRSSRPSP